MNITVLYNINCSHNGYVFARILNTLLGKTKKTGTISHYIIDERNLSILIFVPLSFNTRDISRLRTPGYKPSFMTSCDWILVVIVLVSYFLFVTTNKLGQLTDVTSLYHCVFICS